MLRCLKLILILIPLILRAQESLPTTPLLNFIDIRKDQVCKGDVFDILDQTRFQYDLGTQMEKQILSFDESPLPSFQAMLNRYSKRYRRSQFRLRMHALRYPVEECWIAIKDGAPLLWPDIKCEVEAMAHDIDVLGKRAEKFESKKLSLSEIQWSAAQAFANVGRIGLGFEIYTRPDAYVEIWALWHARSREVKRIHKAPLMTIEAAAIHPEFFNELEKGLFFEAAERTPPHKLEIPVEHVGYNSKKIADKHFILVPDDNPLSSGFSIRYLIDFMDLGCVTRLLLQ